LTGFGPAGRGRVDDGLRPSLYRTARGAMPLGAWLRLPAARLRARLGSEPERPWIVPASIGWLRRRMRSDWVVLELGSGRSTLWLARRASFLLSFEDNPFWATRTREQLREAGVENSMLRELPIGRFLAELDLLPDASFDLIVVDFLEAPGAERGEAARVARSKLRPGGYLLLDDSDRPAYAPAFAMFEGWRTKVFAGVKDGWPQAVETTVFQRPK
jgi:predicted O-methyltransferase YrrM